MEDEKELCANCKREIPSVNYVMHSVHCHRNIGICPKCKEPIPRSEMAKHEAEEHSDVPCSSCGQLVENSKMLMHKADKCPNRRVTCSFCELDIGASERADHENYCGSRTEKCDECGEFVMMKYRSLHLDSNHGFIKLTDEPGPPASWEANKPNTKSAITSAANMVQYSPLKSILKSSPLNGLPLASSSSSPYSYNKRNALFSKKPDINQLAQTPVTVDVGNRSDDERKDREFALRLAREEREMVYSSVAPEFNTMPLTTMKAFMTNSDDEEELAAALFEKPMRYPALKSESPPLEEVELPCEFCGVLVPASRLILHQTGCRPDIARVSQPLGSNSSSRRDRGIDGLQNYLLDEPPKAPESSTRCLKEFGGFAKSPNTKDMIPCDLCNTCVPLNTFLQHQLACEIHHLPGSQPIKRPQALVMPLSGRSLKVKNPLENLSSSDSLKNVLQQSDNKKLVKKPALPSGLDIEVAERAPQPNPRQLRIAACRSANKTDHGQINAAASSGAIPKQKAGGIPGKVSQEVQSSSSTSRLSKSTVKPQHQD